MIYVKSNPIKKRDIENVYAFRREATLRDYDVQEKTGFFYLYKEFPVTVEKEKLEEDFTSFSKLIDSNVALKIAGLDGKGEIVAIVISGKFTSMTVTNAINYCLTTNEQGLRVFKKASEVDLSDLEDIEM